MTEPHAAPTVRSSRRSMLRLAGTAAAGGAASLVVSSRAVADIGYTTSGTTAVGDVVRQQLNGSRSTEIGFLFATVSSPMLTDNSTSFPAALGAMAIDGDTESAAYFYCDTYRGNGTVSESEGESGVGVRAIARGVQSTGVVAMGGAAALELQTNDGALPHPPDRSTAHNAGMVSVGPDGTLWYCVANGTPGTWRKLAGSSTAGTFHAITPTRVYDSRSAAPAQGKLAGGNHRTVAIKDGRDLSTGAVTDTDIVPAGATAIAVNVGITQTVTGGWLTVNPGGTTAIGASSINWSATGQVLANGIIAKINESTRELTVVAGGAGETHFFLDVTGYWR